MSWFPVLPVGWLALATLVVLAPCVLRLVRGPYRGRWVMRTLAVLAVAGTALGPALPRQWTEPAGAAVDVFFVVDRTGSMAAEDWSTGLPRLDGVRHDVPALAQALPGARFSVLAWDSEAVRQLPLTTDTRALESWAQTVRQEITFWSTGSSIDRPLDALTRALEGAAERNPGHMRLVFLLSDGEQTVEEQRASFAALATLVDGGAVLGYGTAQGGPMRSYDGSLDPAPDAPYIPDPDDAGRPGLSKADEANLRALADELGVPYLHRAEPDDAVATLVEDVDPQQVAGATGRERTSWSPVVWPFALVVAGVLLAETWLSVTDLVGRRRRRSP